MAKTILEVYNENLTELGVDTISYTAGLAAATPYSIDDTLNADEQVLTAQKFLQARGGELDTVPYSSTVDKDK